MDNSGRVAAAFFFGAIIGGVAGLLFAPKTGKESRGHMHRYMKDTEEKLNRKKDELRQRFDKVISATKKSGDSGEES